MSIYVRGNHGGTNGVAKMVPVHAAVYGEGGGVPRSLKKIYCTIPALIEEQHISPVKSAWESVAQKGTVSSRFMPGLARCD